MGPPHWVKVEKLGTTDGAYQKMSELPQKWIDTIHCATSLVVQKLSTQKVPNFCCLSCVPVQHQGQHAEHVK